MNGDNIPSNDLPNRNLPEDAETEFQEIVRRFDPVLWGLPPYKSPEFMAAIMVDTTDPEEALERFRRSMEYYVAVAVGLIVDDEWQGWERTAEAIVQERTAEDDDFQELIHGFYWTYPPYKSDQFMLAMAAWPPLTLERFRKRYIYQLAVDIGLIVDDEWMGPLRTEFLKISLYEDEDDTGFVYFDSSEEEPQHFEVVREREDREQQG